MSFLLRVVLPDKPGSLGAVATALGTALVRTRRRAALAAEPG